MKQGHRGKQQHQQQKQGGKRGSKSEVARRVLQDGRADKAERAQAVVQLEECARDGDAEAMWVLGVCCEHGIGTAQDLGRARELYEASQEKGCRTGGLLVECPNRNGLGSRELDLKSVSSQQFRAQVQTSLLLLLFVVTILTTTGSVHINRQMQWEMDEIARNSSQCRTIHCPDS